MTMARRNEGKEFGGHMSELINIAEIFGENVFDDATTQERLPKKV